MEIVGSRQPSRLVVHLCWKCNHLREKKLMLEDLSLFKISMMDVPNELLPLYFDQYTNPMVVGIVRKMGFFPGMGLVRRNQGLPKFPNFKY